MKFVLVKALPPGPVCSKTLDCNIDDDFAALLAAKTVTCNGCIVDACGWVVHCLAFGPFWMLFVSFRCL